jgi:hypothetical protein
MRKVNAVTDKNMLRNLSSAFSRSAFTDVLQFDDYAHFDWLTKEYQLRTNISYAARLQTIYSKIAKSYRCEYVYKNELLKMLLREFGSRQTVFFSEFRVGTSIADMVMFNGQSKAFEIKTEYDTPKRLKEQLDNYTSLFDKCYIVIPAACVEEYKDLVADSVGIITMQSNRGKLYIETVRDACVNTQLNVELMMSCLRTSEYRDMALSLGYQVQTVPKYDLYRFCSDCFLKTEVEILKPAFVKQIKSRKNNTSSLAKYPMAMRQMILSLNLTTRKADVLMQKLSVSKGMG